VTKNNKKTPGGNNSNERHQPAGILRGAWAASRELPLLKAPLKDVGASVCNGIGQLQPIRLHPPVGRGNPDKHAADLGLTETCAPSCGRRSDA